ncbi:hypothetical protein [Mycoplasmopsis columbinasalis]|uniref:Uncharacterized protein n=1 Tax=Mycoplasmopsis columbinasalis TaxID=114880 RepID=A0A449BB36_9BACT|nr:hypothetical protein [Mycoplasmopsis columbinasalis]VEU78248.1 Uncharacterised protein [Mycoplasmopsis columbinasalis]
MRTFDEKTDQNNDSHLIDLSEVKNKVFKFKEYTLSALKEKIVKNINDFLKDEYDLQVGQHYTLKTDEIAQILQANNSSNNEIQSGEIYIYPITNVSKNQAKITYFNEIDEQAENDIEVAPKTNKLENEIKQEQKNKILKIALPIGIVSALSLAALAWFIKIRYFRKGIK